MSSELRGTLSGGGDWAKERLAFGFMIEDRSNGVYRLWGRPWLVTKMTAYKAFATAADD